MIVKFRSVSSFQLHVQSTIQFSIISEEKRIGYMIDSRRISFVVGRQDLKVEISLASEKYKRFSSCELEVIHGVRCQDILQHLGADRYI